MRWERLLLAVLLVVLAAAGGVSLMAATIRYDRAQRRYAALAIIATAPAPRIAPLLPPRDRVSSAGAAAVIVRRAAVRAGLLVEDMSPAPVAPPNWIWIPAAPIWEPARPGETKGARPALPLVQFRLVASGSGSAILRLAEQLEGGRPLVRFAQWRVARTAGGGAMRLTAIVQAVGP